jgi:hypothetical protein
VTANYELAYTESTRDGQFVAPEAGHPPAMSNHVSSCPSLNFEICRIGPGVPSRMVQSHFDGSTGHELTARILRTGRGYFVPRDRWVDMKARAERGTPAGPPIASENRDGARY